MSKWIEHNPEEWGIKGPPSWLEDAEVVIVKKRDGQVETTPNPYHFIWNERPGRQFRIVAFRAIGSDGEDIEEPPQPPVPGVFRFKDGHVKLEQWGPHVSLVVCDREGKTDSHCPKILSLKEDTGVVETHVFSRAAEKVGFRVEGADKRVKVL